MQFALSYCDKEKARNNSSGSVQKLRGSAWVQMHHSRTEWCFAAVSEKEPSGRRRSLFSFLSFFSVPEEKSGEALGEAQTDSGQARSEFDSSRNSQ